MTFGDRELAGWKESSATWWLGSSPDHSGNSRGQRVMDQALTPSAGLDEEHLGFVLQERAVGVVEGLKHPVQLKHARGHNYTHE